MPRNLVVGNLVGLPRFENGVRRKLDLLLLEAFREVNLILTTKYGNLTPYQRSRLASFRSLVERAMTEAAAAGDKLLAKELQGLARVQGEAAERLLARSLRVGGVAETDTVRLTAPQLKAIVTAPVEGAVLADWWAKLGRDATFNVTRSVQLGLLRGETIQQISRRVFTADGTGGVFGGVRRNATMMVRTAVTQVANQAHYDTFAANSDVTEEYQYVATLDDRTTEICASLDGQTFRYDDPSAPKPPQHWGCRSVIIPVIKWDSLGVTAPGDDGLTRASMDGPVRFKTYEQWLRDQPQAVQDEVLGVGKAKLFRDGEIGLKDLIKQDGSVVTLRELERRLGN